MVPMPAPPIPPWPPATCAKRQNCQTSHSCNAALAKAPGDRDLQLEYAQLELVALMAAEFEEHHRQRDGVNGWVSIQANPYRDEDEAHIIAMALAGPRPRYQYFTENPCRRCRD